MTEGTRFRGRGAGCGRQAFSIGQRLVRSRTGKNETVNSPTEIDALFERLSGSAFRRRFTLRPKERDYLAAKGLDAVLAHGREFVEQRLAPAEPANDGKQTPMRGHPVFIAQHATATCCRSCLAKWHRIEAGRPLSDLEKEHVLAVLARWLSEAPADVAPRPPRQRDLFD